MSRLNHVDRVLAELGQEMGIAELTLDSDHRAELQFNEIPVSFVYSAEPLELLWLIVDLGEIPTQGADAPEFLLYAATSCWSRGNMTIGLNAEGNGALGFTVVPVTALDQQTLTETLTELLNVAEPIRERLVRQNFTVEPSTETEAADSSPLPGNIIIP